MDIKIIDNSDYEQSQKILLNYYQDNLIPPEKKPYLTDLRHSVGAFLGIKSTKDETHYILDAASQIATLGFGFNPQHFFGTAHFLETWTNDPSTIEFKALREAFESFIARKLNWKRAYLTFVNSGAEANETALGHCYNNRIHKSANKVLAFEGSFHGRMMITLAATWNKSKREPFEWKNYLAEYVTYPELDDNVMNCSFPEKWREVWDNSPLKEFAIPSHWAKDAQLNKEIESLLAVREKLLSKKIFAILIEPMQCEGGDCYSSDRFHTALLLMAKSFKIPVIHDEVQTGFHLGREFFWHKQLNLKDQNNEPLEPDYVVCAKKAQIGMVISKTTKLTSDYNEEFSVASAYRGYAHAISLDQYQQKIINIEETVTPLLKNFVIKYAPFIDRSRANGLAFAFDLKDSTLLNKFVDLRFKYGLLYYPAGNKTLRFRLNLAFGDKEIDFLFEQLSKICDEIFLNKIDNQATKISIDLPSSDHIYNWHQTLLENKINILQGRLPDYHSLINSLREKIDIPNEHELIVFNSENYSSFREEIINIQKNVYESARQTDIEKFDLTIKHPSSICLGIKSLLNNKLLAIAFAGPLNLYPFERGLRQDSCFNDEACLYMLDVTVLPDQQKFGLGRSLKYALMAIGAQKNIKKIQGRNRDRLAASMLNINLSIGAVEQKFFEEDYPDFEKYRSVFYYTTSPSWKKPELKLSTAINTPLGFNSINMDYVKKQLPFLINKVCLSNFVSEEFLSNLKEISQELPIELRHIYTCSGQSEATDKAIKTIWVQSSQSIKENSIQKLLTFNKHFFGVGSALSRSLSIQADPYFDVTKLDNPTKDNYIEILEQVENEFKKSKYLAVWIEPILQKTLEKVPLEFLLELRKLTLKYEVALVFNETASQFYRYSCENFFLASMKEIMPDVGMVFMSGQFAIVYSNSKYYLDKPLMLISTWDGDEFSLNTYHHAFKKVTEDLLKYKSITKLFSKKLIAKLSKYDIDLIQIENGCGYFIGNISEAFAKKFNNQGNHFIVCPSYDDMLEFLKDDSH